MTVMNILMTKIKYGTIKTQATTTDNENENIFRSVQTYPKESKPISKTRNDSPQNETSYHSH